MRKVIFFFCLAMLLLIIFSSESAIAKAHKRVFIEQYTSAHCGTCPDGIYTIEGILLSFPDEVISAKLHLDDVMQIDDCNKISDHLNPNVRPTASIDRKQYNPANGTIAPVHFYGWYSDVDERLKVPAIAGIYAKYAYIKPDSIEIKFTVVFDSIPKMNMALNYYVIEDNVSGGSEYDQANSYNDLKEHPFYKKGDPVKDFIHQNVVRSTGGDIKGIKGSLPPADEIEIGKAYFYTVRSFIKPDWKSFNLKVEALVQYDDSLDISVDNAVYADFDLSSDDNKSNSNDIGIFPNPAYDNAITNIKLQKSGTGKIYIYNSIGEKVKEVEQKLPAGDTTLPIDFSNFSKGAYFLVLEINNNLYKTYFTIIR